MSYNQRVPDARHRPMDATTRYCAVLGHPVRHSASPSMQNAGIEVLGLNWRYLAFDVHPDDLRAAIAGAKTMRFVGLNLTVPHKLLALELVDEIEDSARVWGAVNTIRFEARDARGDWVPLAELAPEAISAVRARGFNTDVAAIARAVREDLGLEFHGARVLLLGAGGAGRVAALKCAADGASVLHLVNRTAARSSALAEEIRRRFPGVDVREGYPPNDSVDLLLNATSLGLNPGDPLPLDQDQFPVRRARAVYDMIYRPAETPLLKAARMAGCRIANGLSMLLYQGAEALRIWSGQTPPLAAMRHALEENVYG